jgi:hypothetical protein
MHDRHARRSTIQPEDIKLVMRKNPDLVERFHAHLQCMAANKPAKKTKKEDKLTMTTSL